MKIYVHVLLFAATLLGQSQSQSLLNDNKPLPLPAVNPNYPQRNPFYFEGRIDWSLLNIATPSNAWEFAQRGIHKQDDLEDYTGAIADYQMALQLNSPSNSTCQILTSVPGNLGPNVNPPPCMFTMRLRLANLLKSTDPKSAIALYQEVLKIDPLRLGVNASLGEAYTATAEKATDDQSKSDAYAAAIAAYNAEIALSPVTADTIALTGDEANNAHVHWALAEIYRTLARDADMATELSLYLKATKWHSDTYSWRIQLANARLAGVQGQQKKKSQ